MKPRRIRAERMDEMNTATMRAEALSTRLLGLVDVAEPRLCEVSEPESTEPILTGGWSRKQIIGHLIDSASNNHQRFVRALLQDEIHLPTYDQEGNVRVQRYQEMQWGQLVGLWESYNRFLAHVLAGVPNAKLSTLCYIGNNPVMTLEELAEDYVRHMQHHLDQCVT